MSDNTEPDHFRFPRKTHGDLGEVAGELFHSQRDETARAKDNFDRSKSDGHRPPPKPSVYLWLCCEGWMKFGPFEWLRFDDERQAILDPDGEEVAKQTDGYWRMPDGRGKGMQFSNPTITSSPLHPHRDCGSHPGRIR